MTDLLIIIGLTLASCVAVGLIGLFLLHVLRYRSLRHQLTIATLLPVVAVATTVLINVQLMFLSTHDSLVILIALLVSLVLPRRTLEAAFLGYSMPVARAHLRGAAGRRRRRGWLLRARCGAHGGEILVRNVKGRCASRWPYQSRTEHPREACNGGRCLTMIGSPPGSAARLSPPGRQNDQWR